MQDVELVDIPGTNRRNIWKLKLMNLRLNQNQVYQRHV